MWLQKPVSRDALDLVHEAVRLRQEAETPPERCPAGIGSVEGVSKRWLTFWLRTAAKIAEPLRVRLKRLF